MVALAVITLLFYPFVRDTPLLDELTEWMPEVLLRAFVVPLVLLAYAIVEGTGAIVGEEERGTLDLLLSNPLTRRRVVVEKFAADGDDASAGDGPVARDGDRRGDSGDGDQLGVCGGGEPERQVPRHDLWCVG